MKKILTTVAILALFSFTFTACKKEKAQTTAEKIVGKWQMSNLIYNAHVNGADNIVSTNSFTANDTYEFKSDGSVYVNYQGQADSSTYTITSDNKLTITDDTTYDIKKLDANSLVLYVKSINGSDYEEATITFKR